MKPLDEDLLPLSNLIQSLSGKHELMILVSDASFMDGWMDVILILIEIQESRNTHKKYINIVKQTLKEKTYKWKVAAAGGGIFCLHMAELKVTVR